MIVAILTGLILFLLPGTVWSAWLGFRGRDPLSRLALAFILSFALQVLLVPVGFGLRLHVGQWLIVYLLVGLAPLVRFKGTRWNWPRVDRLGAANLAGVVALSI